MRVEKVSPGVVTAATLRIVNPRPAFCLAFVACPTEGAALAFVECLRRHAAEAWSHSNGSQGIDVSAIESMDERCLTLIREDGIDRVNGVTIAADAAMALLVTLELSPDLSPEQAYDEIGRARDAVSAGADYLAFGSFFPSATKPGTVRATPDVLRAARTAWALPIVAIA